MGWRDQLQKTSFRDVEFFVAASDADLGRRVQVHEFPLRDKPFVEDLGRKTRRFTLEAYVLGNDYMDKRDALIAALEQPGPGDLVHRYLGRMSVVVQDSRGPRESTREGGMATFSITFVESGARLFPSAKPATVSQADTAANACIAAAETQLAENFVIPNQPAFVLDAATTILQDASSAVRKAVGAINVITAPLTTFTDGISDFNSSLGTLIRTPSVLAARVASLMGSIRDVAGTAKATLAGFKNLFIFGAAYPALSGDAGSLQRQAKNQTALVRVVRQIALAEAYRAAATVPFESADEAQAERDALLDALDAQTADASDAVFAAFDDLRAALVRDIAQRIVQLPQVFEHTPHSVLPALVLAHQLHGNLDNLNDLIARNHVRHPGFVSGGVALRVLR